MAADATLTSRYLYLEDMAVTTNPSGETTNANIMQADGSTLATAVHKLALVLLTQFGQYANDAAAAAGGVPVGKIYYNTTDSALFARQS